MYANSYIQCGKFRPYLKPYWKSNNLGMYHYEQREARRLYTNNSKHRNKSNNLYKDYKNKKREFRKRKRQANIIWKEEKYEDIKKAAEIDIGEFYRTVRKMKKTG